MINNETSRLSSVNFKTFNAHYTTQWSRVKEIYILAVSENFARKIRGAIRMKLGAHSIVYKDILRSKGSKGHSRF